MDRTIRKAVIILFFSSCAIIAEQKQELFLHGNQMYEQKKFNKAVQYYTKIHDKGAAVWYNLGNCYYHAHNFPKAIVCWHRSEKGASGSLYKNAHDNILYAYQKSGKSLPALSFAQKIAQTMPRIPIFSMQLLFLVSWLFLWVLLFRRHKAKIWFLALLGVGTIVFYSFFGIWHLYQKDAYEYGIVAHKKVPLYIGPNEQYHGAGSLDYLDIVKLIEKRNGWYKIIKDEAPGWVIASAIELIDYQEEEIL